MSILTVDVGGSPITVQCQRGGHAQPRRAGGPLTSFAGTQRANVRAELMVVPVVLIDYSPTTVASIRALFANGAQVPCSGDVFNNGGATIVCSATIADEFEPAGPWFGISMTLYEVGTTLGYTPAIYTAWLTGLVSDLDPGDSSVYIASLVDTNPGDTTRSIRVLDTETGLGCGTIPDTSVDCATHTSLTPERSWYTRPLAAGWLVGAPAITINSKGGTGDWLAHQGSLFSVYQWRSGVDIAGPFDTPYGGNGGFSGSDVTVSTTDSLVLTIQANDRFRFELKGRIALHSGYADGNVPGDFSNLYRQIVTHGYLGGSPGLAYAILSGSVAEL